MRVIDAEVLFDLLHDRMKGAEAWITRAETDEIRSRAEGFLSALIEIKMSVEDEVTTITMDAEVKEQPTIDAVKVVRCEECMYWQDNNGGYINEWCKWRTDETPDPDDYCSCGVFNQAQLRHKNGYGW